VRRRLFNLATALLLVLCVVACVEWVRSYRVSDWWMWVSHPGTPSAEHRFSLGLHSGQFGLSWNRIELFPPDQYSSRVVYFSHIAHETRRPPVQFWARQGGRSTNWSLLGFLHFENSVHAPAWSVVGVLAAVAMLSARPWRWRALRRMSKGLCPNCGYDLRATPEKGAALLERCPECGTVSVASRLSEDAI
jgi:hypothetical protein